MGSVVTAISMSLLFVALSITLLCASSLTSASYLLRSWPNDSPGNETIIYPTNQNNSTEQQFELFYQRVPIEAFIAMVTVSSVIAFIASGLLLHLFAFHVYIKAIGKN